MANNGLDRVWKYSNTDKWFTFDPATESEYYDGKIIPDITTLCVAARAGRLEFLKWCHSRGYANRVQNDKTMQTYSQDQPEVMEWLKSLDRSRILCKL